MRQQDIVISSASLFPSEQFLQIQVGGRAGANAWRVTLPTSVSFSLAVMGMSPAVLRRSLLGPSYLARKTHAISTR